MKLFNNLSTVILLSILIGLISSISLVISSSQSTQAQDSNEWELTNPKCLTDCSGDNMKILITAIRNMKISVVSDIVKCNHATVSGDDGSSTRKITLKLEGEYVKPEKGTDGGIYGEYNLTWDYSGKINGLPMSSTSEQEGGLIGTGALVDGKQYVITLKGGTGSMTTVGGGAPMTYEYGPHDFSFTVSKKNSPKSQQSPKTQAPSTQTQKNSPDHYDRYKGKGIDILPCFIATAAYGSSTATQLDTLRAFRDKVLMKTEIGFWFVKTYYFLSPPLAEFIADKDALKAVVRFELLDPLVFTLIMTQQLWNN
jgi:hypothetical protein